MKLTLNKEHSFENSPPWLFPTPQVPTPPPVEHRSYQVPQEGSLGNAAKQGLRIMQHTHQIQDVLVLGSDFHAQGTLMERQPKMPGLNLSPTSGAEDGNQLTSTCSPGSLLAQKPPEASPHPEMFMQKVVSFLVENKSAHRRMASGC